MIKKAIKLRLSYETPFTSTWGEVNNSQLNL